MEKTKLNYNMNRGITLIALIITIIILLILAGVVLVGLIRSGILNIADKSTTEYNKQEATENINLKITKIQIESYSENKKMPTLQYLADKLCEDSDMEYVIKKQTEIASLDKIDVSDVSSIFTKLKKYPYEFEINSSLQLASIDGIKIANNPETVTIGKEEYEEMKNNLDKLSNKSAITVSSSGEYAVNASQKKVIFDKIDSSVGNGLTIEDGGVKIGKGIKYVLVSASCYVVSIDGKGYGLMFKVNEESKYFIHNRAGGTTTGVSTGTYLLEVNEGDIVYLYDDNTSGGGSISNNVLSVIEY